MTEQPIKNELADSDDPFYSEGNIRHILKSMQQIRDGKVVVTTTEQLEAMEKEDGTLSAETMGRRTCGEEAINAMKEASRIAEENGIADMSLDEINEEIAAARRAGDFKEDSSG